MGIGERFEFEKTGRIDPEAKSPSAWSDEPPTEEGWYWWRDSKTQPMIIQLRLFDDDAGLEWWEGESWEPITKQGQWQPVEGPRP